VELIILSTFPATSRRTVRKMKPVNVPIATQAIMILGPWTEALGISGAGLACLQSCDLCSDCIDLRSYGLQHPDGGLAKYKAGIA